MSFLFAFRWVCLPRLCNVRLRKCSTLPIDVELNSFFFLLQCVIRSITTIKNNNTVLTMFTHFVVLYLLLLLTYRCPIYTQHAIFTQCKHKRLRGQCRHTQPLYYPFLYIPLLVHRRVLLFCSARRPIASHHTVPSFNARREFQSQQRNITPHCTQPSTFRRRHYNAARNISRIHYGGGIVGIQQLLRRS